MALAARLCRARGVRYESPMPGLTETREKTAVPSEWAGRRIALSAECVNSFAEVFVERQADVPEFRQDDRADVGKSRSLDADAAAGAVCESRG